MAIWVEGKIIGILVMFNYAHITFHKGKHRYARQSRPQSVL